MSTKGQEKVNILKIFFLLSEDFSAIAINSLVALMQFVHLQFMEGFCNLTHIYQK